MDKETKQENLQLNHLLSRRHDVGDGDDVQVESDDERKERGQWGTKLDYILSMVGYCVGLGNLWRFPYLCNRNGGGAFLVQFLFFLLVCGLPMFFLEVTIAQFSGKGPTRVCDICPIKRYNTLRISGGLEEMGELQWHLVLCLLGSWIIVFFCLIRGVRSVGKVVYVTATLPYLLLLILLIRGLTLPGAVDGLIFYLKPDFGKLLEVQVWLEACLQVFYSLGPAWSGLITMASYNKFNNNCVRDSIIVSCISEGTSIFAGFVIFTILGGSLIRFATYACYSGPGLGFVAYPQALSGLPIPQLWSVIFFVMLLTLGLDSQIKFDFMVIYPFLIRALIWLLKGGIYMFQLSDWYVAALILIISIMECIIVAWIYGETFLTLR
ncbi:LOW QUALITY PROTEIN: sodium- and chloride-dependent GABA transporter 3-like [Gigantopelta aegis]|uniref:LOW QUALITY PROTEIN: sodium- and chloride-dependent GABA transporter 3-like n=1 Tax=Gigantopelta aegis TaxID=1735272 RepID=UPI001B88A18B|nr:LOW QUALITY PROTEIN: sodium- and chloride-dependent GABA transporter 3-like [Gigantopelta aegis]